VNSPYILFSKNHPNVKYHENPYLYKDKLSGKEALLLPWINDENLQESINAIENTKAEYAFAHLQLNGFQMHKGQYSEDGFDHHDLDKFKHVFTGHYHERSSIDNITYVGAPYEMIWSDYNCQRGFELLDFETGERIYIQNPHSIFKKIIYDEKQLKTFKTDMSEYKDCYVKVSVINKVNQKLFDGFVDNLEKFNPIDIQIIDEMYEFDMERTDIDINETEDTLSIMNKYIDSVKMDFDKPLIKSKITELYYEAINIERE
jgi:hypothetical protein